jgi:nitrate/nitrite-specific signal transduction histidine kinase
MMGQQFVSFHGIGTVTKAGDGWRGFEPQEADRGDRPGLRGMRERGRGIRETLRIESSPDRGTTIHVAVPADRTPHR